MFASYIMTMFYHAQRRLNIPSHWYVSAAEYYILVEGYRNLPHSFPKNGCKVGKEARFVIYLWGRITSQTCQTWWSCWLIGLLSSFLVFIVLRDGELKRSSVKESMKEVPQEQYSKILKVDWTHKKEKNALWFHDVFSILCKVYEWV